MDKPTIYVVVESIGGVSHAGNEYYTTLEKAQEVERQCIYEKGSDFSEEEMKIMLGADFVPAKDSMDFLYHPVLGTYFSISTDNYEVHIEEMSCGD